MVRPAIARSREMLSPTVEDCPAAAADQLRDRVRFRRAGSRPCSRVAVERGEHVPDEGTYPAHDPREPSQHQNRRLDIAGEFIPRLHRTPPRRSQQDCPH